MRHTLAALSLALVTTAACGDDPVKPGSLNVKWNHPSTASCDSRHIAHLEARALRGTEVVAQQTASCPAADRSGMIPLVDLDPGTYRIEVEGYDAADKGTYLGVIAKQKVFEGKATDTETILLSQKPIFLHVGWTLPGGQLCAAAGITEVEVEVIYDAGTKADVVGTQRVPCDNSLKDPRDATKTLAGVVFEDLAPNDDVSVTVTGYDSKDAAVARTAEDGLVFAAGDEVDRTIALTSCPGTPPSCD